MTVEPIERVAALPDDQAVAVLELVLERRGLTVDPFTADEQQAHLQEALAQPEITDQVSPTAASDGDLARTALTHLLDTDPTAEPDVERAIALAAEPGQSRDLVLVGVGALVLLAFRADIDLAYDPGKGWRFRFKTKGLSDSTIGQLLAELLGNLLPKP
jgi:hypothetical protein